MNSWALQIFAAALMFIWPIPHTVALRYIVMLLAVLWLAYVSFKQPAHWRAASAIKTPIVLYAILTAWILIQIAFISTEPKWAISEFNGQWVRSTITFILGIGMGCWMLQEGSAKVRRMIVVMATILALQVLINFADDVWIRIATGQWPIAESIITGTKTGMSYVTNLLMAFLVAEGVFRITRHQRLLPIGNYSVLILFLFSLFTTLLLDARNGTVGVIFLLLSAVLLTWFEYRHRISKLRLGLGLTVVIIGIAAFATATVKMDPTHRWQTFVQTIPIAWDTEHNKAWLDRDKYPYPTLPNGQMVSPSNYERIAWFKEACIMIGEHPWGMGFGRLAFGHALYEIYGEEGYHHHAHSAVLDFTIGTGIPGILLWLVFIGSAFMMAWRGYFKTHIPEALILLFIITGFFGRSLDDGNMRDHMMEQFMFLLGLFLTMVQGKVSSTTSTEQS